MRYRIISYISILLFLLITENGFAFVKSAGFIQNVKGDVFIITQQSSVRAVSNMKIMEGDIIKTGRKSSIGIIFEDDTVLSLGSSSEIEISEFLFEPAEKKLSFVAKLIKGTFSFIAGQIAKLSPDKVKLETPNATLGIRGTKFLVKID